MLPDEIVALANEKSALTLEDVRNDVSRLPSCFDRKSPGLGSHTGSVIASYQSTGSTLWVPLYLSSLASAYARNGQFADAERCIGEA